MRRARTTQETNFLEYFQKIDRRVIVERLSRCRSTGPIGYTTSLILARVLKVKERISSDREFSEKPAKVEIYRGLLFEFARPVIYILTLVGLYIKWDFLNL